MRDKKLIVRVIVRDCAILRQTKYLVPLLKVSLYLHILSHHCTPTPCPWHFLKMRAVLSAQNPTEVSSENSL